MPADLRNLHVPGQSGTVVTVHETDIITAETTVNSGVDLSSAFDVVRELGSQVTTTVAP